MAASQHPPWLVPASCALAAAAVAAFSWRKLRRWSEEEAVAEALARIDRAHASPFSKPNEADYCAAIERWSSRLRQLAGEQASPALRLGARAQHLERGAIPRKSYPEGRDGYLKWRAAVKRRQGRRVEELLNDLATGLGSACVDRVKCLVSKTLPLRPHMCSAPEQGDAEMQCIEDAACLVFLERELKDGFPDGRDDAKMIDILQKTWRKMSRVAHAEALTLDYTPRMLGCVVEAIAEVEAAAARLSSAAPFAASAPALSNATYQTLVATWAACRDSAVGGSGGTGSVSSWGEAWYEELRQTPGYAEDLGKVLEFSVCRPDNVTKVVDILLDLLPVGDAPVAVDTNAPLVLPRFVALLRAASLLSQRHAGFRLRHLDAMRCALVSAACKHGVRGLDGDDAERRCSRAWEAFSFAIGAQVAPALMLSDPTSDFTGAVATALPTPGAVPCAAVLAAKGLGLVEMAIRILHRKQKAGEEQAWSLPVGRLEELRRDACICTSEDAHAYCGLLAAAVFDHAGGDQRMRKDRRATWTRRCTAVPLRVASSAIEGAEIAVDASGLVKQRAASAIGDLIAGGSLLIESAQLTLKMAELNLGGADTALDDMRSSSEALCKRLAALRNVWGSTISGSTV